MHALSYRFHLIVANVFDLNIWASSQFELLLIITILLLFLEEPTWQFRKNSKVELGQSWVIWGRCWNGLVDIVEFIFCFALTLTVDL